ncbi:MAG: hypothetical protein RLZZ136_1203, partial [Pseudomonadota bacterium]
SCYKGLVGQAFGLTAATHAAVFTVSLGQ